MTVVTDVLFLRDDAVDIYANVLSAVADSLSTSNVKLAAERLQPIAGDLWQGRLSLSGPAGPGSQSEMRRGVSDRTRAQVFRRDGFRCRYCGKRAVPRCILVAISEVFPNEFAYHRNYAWGRIHPAFWALASEVDHVLAHSRGGASLLGNLATLHTICNARKSDSLLGELPTLELTDEASDWDGLLSRYVGIVIAGNTLGYRHSATNYHRGWFRNFELPSSTP